MELESQLSDRLPASAVRRGVLAALLVLMPLVAYLPALDGEFVWDDDYNVTHNLHLRDLDGLKQIWLDTRSTQQYYPLTHTSFWIDYQLWELNPLGYHLGNVALHAGSALLLWLVLLRLGVPGAWLAAAIFAVHPVHVESVAWITERKNALSGLFYLAAALAYLRFTLGNPSRRLIAALAWALFACALLAKTVTATLPVALALVVWWRRGRLEPRDLSWLGSMLAAGTAMGLLTLSLETHFVGARGAEFSLSWVERTLVAGRALWFYAGKLVWPVDLAFSYSRWHIDAGAILQYAFPVSAAAVAAALWMLRRRLGMGPFVAAAYFAITVGPALGFLNVYYLRYAFVADHFQYLASIGPIALLAAALSRVELPPLVARTLGGLLLVVLGSLTWHQAGAYEDQETLWRRSIAAEPGSYMAHFNLGELLDRREAMDEALMHYRESLRIHPRWSNALVNIGSILGRQGKVDEALRHFDRALEIAPEHALTHFNRGVALEMKGRTDQAVAAYREAIRLQPDLTKARNNLALLLSGQARPSGGVPERPPNFVFIVWDTVRADHLSLYGYPLETTPKLDRWAATARVFDCTAVSCWTVPSHASMFTGLFPSEHGVNSERSVLPADADTIAEAMQSNGYQTYLFSANPFISVNHGFAQGFEIEEHPYDAQLVELAKDAIRKKLDPQETSPIRKKIRGEQIRTWSLKASGELATSRFFEFLDHRDPGRPFFAFLNYMEAHRTRVPSRSTRERFLSPDRVQSSYRDTPPEKRFKEVTFRAEESLTPIENQAVRDVYDATLRELDVELDRLLRRLEETGLLEDTVVILTADHGEHLGDHGSYLHQYSLYEGLVRVPLVIWAPGRLEPGRERVPVMNVDLFPTILELAGLHSGKAVSVLHPVADRPLISEYLLPYSPLLKRFLKAHPDWDPSPFERELRTVRVGPYKLHVKSDSPPELYDLSVDAAELSALDDRPDLARQLAEHLETWERVRRPAPAAAEKRWLSPEEIERLKALGYL